MSAVTGERRDTDARHTPHIALRIGIDGTCFGSNRGNGRVARELLEGGGVFIDSQDESGLRDAVLRLAADPALRARLASGAQERTAKLSWDTSAATVRDALLSRARGERQP